MSAAGNADNTISGYLFSLSVSISFP